LGKRCDWRAVPDELRRILYGKQGKSHFAESSQQQRERFLEIQGSRLRSDDYISTFISESSTHSDEQCLERAL
jgi:hypothetical protein